MLRAASLRVILLSSLLASAACAPATLGRPHSPVPAPGAQTRVSERLYFGREIPGGGSVTEEAWTAFLREAVTPRFPAGLTVWRAEGQWLEASGAVIREPTFVMELIHAGDAASERAVMEVVAEYRTRFRQEAVLRVTDTVRVTL